MLLLVGEEGYRDQKLYEKTNGVFAAFFTEGLQENKAELLIVYTAAIMKNGILACVQAVRNVVFHAPCAWQKRLMLHLIQTS